MLRSGEVVEIAVDGPDGRQAGWYVLAEDLSALEAESRRRTGLKGTTLLSPFDSFLWHRERILNLFGYDYRIEIYVPAHKRKFGYYCLPIFHDGRILGRVDAKNHRAERRLEIRSVHFETPELRRGGGAELEAACAGLAETFASLATFTCAEAISLRTVAPARCGAPLRRALRAADPRFRAAPRRSSREAP